MSHWVRVWTCGPHIFIYVYICISQMSRGKHVLLNTESKGYMGLVKVSIIYVFGVPEGEGRKNKAIFDEILTRNESLPR